MDDDSEFYREWKARSRRAHKERGVRNLAKADPAGWVQHTEFHWSRTLNGKQLDYWPSRQKFQYGGKVHTGDVLSFIRKREQQNDQQPRRG